MKWVIMLEDFSLEALVYYLEAHPLITVLLVVMIGAAYMARKRAGKS